MLMEASQGPKKEEEEKKKFICGEQHREIFSQDGNPVKPSLLMAVRSATHFEARLWCVRWSLFSITLLTFMAWALHTRGVMVNMRRWGIVDLRLSTQTHSWKIIPVPPLAPPHHPNQTDTQAVRSYKQMFPRENSWPLTLRSNRGVHVLCAQGPDVFMCVLLCCVFIMFYVCICTKKTPGTD